MLRYNLMQIRCEPNPIMTWSRAFCRAMHSHWFIVLLTFIVRDHFILGLRRSNVKKFYYIIFIFLLPLVPLTILLIKYDYIRHLEY